MHRISGIIPGVMAQTGMETSEIIQGIVAETKPDIEIAIDAVSYTHLIFGQTPEYVRTDAIDMNMYESREELLNACHETVLKEIERMKKSHESVSYTHLGCSLQYL